MSADDHGRRPAPVVDSAPGHVPDRLTGPDPATRPVARPLVTDAGPLHHVAEICDGTLRFTLNAGTLDPAPDAEPAGPVGCAAVVAGDAGADPPAPGSTTPPGAGPQALRQADCRLAFAFTTLDRLLADLRTGVLIRLVVQGRHGAFFTYSVVPGVNLVGAVYTDGGRVVAGAHPRGCPDVDVADEAMSRIVATARSGNLLGSRSPGAFDLPGEDRRVGARAPDDVIHHVGDQDHPWIPACREALSVDDVHLVAHYREGSLVFATDVLGAYAEQLPPDDDRHPLDAPLRPDEVPARRRAYLAWGHELYTWAANLTRIVYPLQPGPLTRIVVDVEQGAIYYLRIRRGQYLVGVTLRQARVGRADLVLDGVAAACAAMPPGPGG